MTSDMTRVVVLANVAATLVLVGLIWFVQIVHYPLFARVGADHFASYEAEHVRATTWVVALPMLVEALTSVILAWRPPSHDLVLVCWIGLGLVIVIWIATMVAQVPQHNTLAGGFDEETHRQLVRGNWIRTISWSLRGVLCLYLTYRLPTAV